MKKLLALLALVPALALASSGGVPLEHAPVNLHDRASLQRGAAIFVNHCLNCHSASAMRYARLTDLGLTEDQIRENLLLAGDKIGETMTTAMDPAVAKTAFGIVPPDLSLAGRSRGSDWLYTYLRSFYRDANSKTGWNNTVFPNVAMPHVLWEYQGQQALEVTQKMDPNTGDARVTSRLAMDKPGMLSRAEYDQYTADLVNYLAFMAEPAQTHRKFWGILALFLLTAFAIVALMLKNEYWKDVK
ncbi:MAG: ubiquinol-cytochrome c reductase cytochrome c1 subunit [Actinomycetota bacterium]|nr:ubiquinol-cytochrome c reductase cytochrome c1 subunit [Actinomycetota bacterium]